MFDFLANSILKEVLSAIQKGKPGAFSPGRPREFLKNYKSSVDFLSHLEGSNWIPFPLSMKDNFIVYITSSGLYNKDNQAAAYF